MDLFLKYGMEVKRLGYGEASINNMMVSIEKNYYL